MLKNLLPSKPGTEPLAEALKACKSHFVWAAVFSALVNLLYLTPGGASLNERGVVPDVVVDVPTVDFGVEPTPGDPVLDKAVESLTAAKKAA